MDWINYIITILSIIGAILAWVAKLKWSKEYTSAKEEIIRAKDEQIIILKERIEQYKEFSPIKLREFHTSVKEQLEEYNELLGEQLKSAKNEILIKENAISKLKKEGNIKSNEVNKLKKEKSILAKESNELEIELKNLRKRMKNMYSLSVIDEVTIKRISEASGSLAEVFANYNLNNQLNNRIINFNEIIKNSYLKDNTIKYLFTNDNLQNIDKNKLELEEEIDEELELKEAIIEKVKNNKV